MRILYYTPGHEIDPVVTSALHSLGHEVTQRVPRQFTGRCLPCDLVIIKSYRDQQRKIAAAYKQPRLVLDWGYFARVNNREEAMDGHWQISYGALNAMPSGVYPDDRLRKSGVELCERKAPKNGYVLACGQMPRDGAVMGTQHGLWLQSVIDNYRSRGLDVRYREHPRGGVRLPGIATADGPLDEALSGASLVVCYNSNVAHEALLAGIPVISDPCAPYAELSGEALPSMARRRAYFSRAAYGQWRADEFAEGFEFSIKHAMERKQWKP